MGRVSFLEMWPGSPNTTEGVFEVDYLTHDAQMECSIWKFKNEDRSSLPPPLLLAPGAFSIGDFLVGVGYCGSFDMEALRSYKKAITDPAIMSLPEPTMDDALILFPPNHKIAAPGILHGIRGQAPGRVSFSIKASMYHGMSGGPVLLIRDDGYAGVVGIIKGKEHSQENANFCIALTGALETFMHKFLS